MEGGEEESLKFTCGGNRTFLRWNSEMLLEKSFTLKSSTMGASKLAKMSRHGIPGKSELNKCIRQIFSGVS